MDYRPDRGGEHSRIALLQRALGQEETREWIQVGQLLAEGVRGPRFLHPPFVAAARVLRGAETVADRVAGGGDSSQLPDFLLGRFLQTNRWRGDSLGVSLENRELR